MAFVGNLKSILIAAAIAMISVSASAGPGEALAAKSVNADTRLTAGKAYVERLGRIYVKQAGMFSTARGGDWRLGNEFVTFTFAAVDILPTSYSMTVGPYEDVMLPESRVPGALIDIDLGRDASRGDTIGWFTQAIGIDPSGITIHYDHLEPVKKGNKVGLRLTGSPYQNRILRIETTYWLADGSRRLEIETRFLDLDPGERIPELVDAANWGVAVPIIKDYGHAPHGNPTPMVTDFFLAEANGFGMAMALRSGQMQGTFQTGAAHLSRVHAARAIETTSGTLAAPRTATYETTQTTFQRDLWVVPGRSADALEAMLRDRNMETGTISGTVHLAGSKFPGKAAVQVLGYERGNPHSMHKLYAVKDTDEKGSYTVTLPAGKWYFVRGELRGAYHMQNISSVKVNKDQDVYNRDVIEKPTHVQVRVVDADTSRPIPARLRFEAVNPTPPLYFGYPETAREYLNNAYVPAEGGMYWIPAGHWKIIASHGIEYDLGTRDIEIARGEWAKVTIPVKRSVPTPGWTSLHVGARTSATPGVTISPEDSVLMAAAEGIEWIVTADFERATDLNPVIKQLGLAGSMRASAGFSTLLPAHPEWGHFLVYPLAKNAPDPAKVSAQWAKVKTAKGFFAILRKNYPGALIHCEMPLDINAPLSRAGGLGYFNVTGIHPFEAAYSGAKSIDFGFDAISVMPSRSRQVWDLNFAGIFWNALWRGGHGRVAAPRASSSFVLGSEPGYPRVLVLTGEDDPSKVSEKALFDAYRQIKTQITSGPFIEMKPDQLLPGEMIRRDSPKAFSFRVVAPAWVDVKRVQITKDGASEIAILALPTATSVLRFPDAKTGWQKYTMTDMRLRDFKDTTLGVTVAGENPINPAVPFCGAQIHPFSMMSPVIVDGNGNGKFDRLENYGDGGR